MNKKIIVWDLFGGGCNSVANAIDKGEYEIHTFDVVPQIQNIYKSENYTYHNLDLAVELKLPNGEIHTVDGFSDIVELFKTLELPKPDIIVSSTLCQSFSQVLSMTGGGTCFWKKENKGGTLEAGTKLVERSIEEFERLKGVGFTKRLTADKQLFIKLLGEQCVLNTVKLIEYFEPKYWYIENPVSSLLWFYLINNLNLKGFLNKASLGAYGYPTAKYAGFFSNIEMNLKNNKYIPEFSEYNCEGEKIFVLKKYNLNDIANVFDNNETNFVYASKGIAYKEPSEKKLICNNFYTYWQEGDEDEYNAYMEHVERLKKDNSSGDQRTFKKDKDGKIYKRWYVETGFSFGDKGHYSLKKTSMTLGKISKKKFKQEDGLTTKQLNEASETSHIPEGLIEEIFKHFKC